MASFLPGALGTFAIAIAQCVNTRKQLAWQKEQFQLNQEGQRANMEEQRRFQLNLHEMDYVRKIRDNAGQYTVTNAWPLTLHPNTIKDNILNGRRDDDPIPLNVIISPPPTSGIQKNIAYIWDELARFMQVHFALHENYPVVVFQDAYKIGYEPRPNTDAVTIYQALSDVPTLFIAPYSTDRDNVMGLTTALWGFGGEGSYPKLSSVTIDMSTMYRKVLREEVTRYRQLVDCGCIQTGSNSRIEKNEKCFLQENQAKERGLSEEEISQYYEIYGSLRGSEDTYRQIGRTILPMLELFTSAISDIYWTLEYGRQPRLPQIIRAEGIAISEDSSRFLEQYGNAILAARESILPRHVINLAADFNSIGDATTARRLIGTEIGLIGKDSFAGDMVSMTMYEKKDSLAPLLSDKTRVLLENWGQRQHPFGSRELELLEGQNTNDSAYWVDAAKDCYSLGRYDRAMELLKIAATNGNTDAMWMIGAYYYLGEVVEKNIELARYWCQRSASLGNEEARKYLADMNATF